MVTGTNPPVIKRQRHGIDAVTTRVTLPLREHQRVRAIAAERETSMSAIVAQAVKVYLALVEHTSGEERTA